MAVASRISTRTFKALNPMTIKFGKVLLAAPIIILSGLVGIYYLFPATAFNLLVRAERAIGGLERHTVQVQGLRFEYLTGGQGETLILLHGFGANKDHWTRIGRYLTPRLRVIAPDLPGFGESSRTPDNDYSIRAQAARVDAFVRALGISAFHLGGSSMGGNIAGVYAATYPEKVKSLLLISPGGVVSAEASEMQRLMTVGGTNPLLAENDEDYDRLMDFVFVQAPFVPRPIKHVLVREATAHRSLNMEIFTQIRQSWQIEPLEALLKGRKVPTLIIWGSRDRVLHVSGAKILEAAMPNARAEIMDSVGHLPMIEKPSATAEVYLKWLP